MKILAALPLLRKEPGESSVLIPWFEALDIAEGGEV